MKICFFGSTLENKQHLSFFWLVCHLEGGTFDLTASMSLQDYCELLPKYLGTHMDQMPKVKAELMEKLRTEISSQGQWETIRNILKDIFNDAAP